VHFSWLGFIEMFVVLIFALAWGVLELVTLRMDKQRDDRRAKSESRDRSLPRD
jgi:hypothetical protein